MYYIGLALGRSIQGIEYKYIYPKYTWPRSVFIAHAWSGLSDPRHAGAGRSVVR